MEVNLKTSEIRIEMTPSRGTIYYSGKKSKKKIVQFDVHHTPEERWQGT